MQKIELKAETRQATGKQAKYLRQEGLVPGVLYGREVETQLLQFDHRELAKVLREAGTHQLISLQIDNQDAQMTLAKEIQRDIIRHNYTHVDLYLVHMDEKLNAQVPIILEGTPPAVTNEGGILTQGLDQLDVECLPGDLLESVVVDVSGLTELNDLLTVADLHLPDTITILSEPESMVAKIEPPRLIEEETEEEEGLGLEVSPEPEVLTARDDDEE